MREEKREKRKDEEEGARREEEARGGGSGTGLLGLGKREPPRTPECPKKLAPFRVPLGGVSKPLLKLDDRHWPNWVRKATEGDYQTTTATSVLLSRPTACFR